MYFRIDEDKHAFAFLDFSAMNLESVLDSKTTKKGLDASDMECLSSSESSPEATKICLN